jgi:hypothetical protein
VGPISWGELALAVSGNVEAFFEEFLGDYASLRQAVHAAPDFAKNITIGVDDVLEIVLVDNVFGEQVKLHSEVFVP